jgi:hypothetical protein
LAVSLRIVKQGKDVLVAACDSELLGKTLKFGKIEFPVRKEFYGDQLVTAEEALHNARSGTTVNLLGERIVQCALNAGLIHPDAVLYVSGIPHALIVRM